MPLPIPDILERAGDVLEAAKHLSDKMHNTDSSVTISDADCKPLRDALKKVSPADLLAVMNEVGKVYAGMHNIQILKIGSRPVPQAKSLEFAMEIDFGLGPRTLMAQLPLDAATNLVKNFNDNLVLAATGSTSTPGKLILDAGAGNGQP